MDENTKKSVQPTTHKYLIIGACGFVGLIVIAGLIWLIIINTTSNMPEAPATTPEKIQEAVTMTYNDAFNEAMGFTDNSDPSVIGPTEESINAATEIYNQAIAEAGENQALTNELVLSQMGLYIMTGDRYEEIIRLGEQINPDQLSTEIKAKYYNYLAEAYLALGNQDEADHYYDLIFELSGGMAYGG